MSLHVGFYPEPIFAPSPGHTFGSYLSENVMDGEFARVSLDEIHKAYRSWLEDAQPRNYDWTLAGEFVIWCNRYWTHDRNLPSSSSIVMSTTD